MKKRNKLVAVLLSCCMAVALFAGCGNNDKGTAENDNNQGEQIEVSEEDKYGGTLRIGMAAVANNIDPVKYTGVYENAIIENIGDTLVVYSDDLSEFLPSLATEWEVNEAGTEYTFKLREDVYFHPGKFQDGRQMTAEDVKYSLERSHNESALARLAMLDHCEVIDDFTVKCVLPNPDASFLAALTNSGNVIVPKEEVEGWGDEFGAHFVGTGPFMMKEWKTDEAVEFVRSENFWGGEVYLDGLNFVYITDINQRVNALKNGDIDIACDLAGEGIEEIKADNNLVMSQEPGMGVNYIYFNMKNGPTADIKVRKALQMAVDRDAMCAALYQYGECSPAYLPLPPASWGYDESLEDLVPKYDVKGAKKLLAEAGYPDGFELEYYTSDSASSKKIGEILQQFCAKVDVKVNIHQASWGTFSEIGASGNADAIGMSWTWFPDPYFYLNKMFHEESLGTLGNGQQFNIPEVNELLDKAVEVSDQEERAKLYKEALKLIVEQYPQIDYCLANINTGLNKKVQNYVVRPDKTIEIAGDGHNVWLAK